MVKYADGPNRQWPWTVCLYGIASGLALQRRISGGGPKRVRLTVIGLPADVATVCAWSTFERLPAGVRDHYARANWIFRLPTLMVWRCAVAGPSWTRSASISTLNPWASML